MIKKMLSTLVAVAFFAIAIVFCASPGGVPDRSGVMYAAVAEAAFGDNEPEMPLVGQDAAKADTAASGEQATDDGDDDALDATDTADAADDDGDDADADDDAADLTDDSAVLDPESAADSPEAIDWPVTGYILGSLVNMRSLPNTESTILTELAKGKAVEAQSLTDGWYRIKYNNFVGYVRADMLTLDEDDLKEKEEEEEPATTETPEEQGAGTAQAVPPAPDEPAEAAAQQSANPEPGANLTTDPPASNGGTSGESAALQTLSNTVQAPAAASDTFFSGTCFIGHSMVVGMSGYFRLPEADFFAVNGISASRFLSYDQFKYTAHSGGETVTRTGTIRDALEAQAYNRVYIMLGANELGPDKHHEEAFYNSLCAIVDVVRSTQQSASIYLIAILPISQSRSETSDYLNRENVIAFNIVMTRVTSDKGVHYIDAFSEFADADGYLPESACSSDGVHILAGEYAKLKKVLESYSSK
ncbi:MAG: GDSL-type esterase/lipase family protein [Oscillospiraceae bacterium]|nr:GDSL-type esterase/lipase family protein [Oscillospiraceae bacterium]